MSFISDYNNKKGTVDDALSLIKSGYTISSSICAMVPCGIYSQLHKLHGRVRGLTIVEACMTYDFEFLKEEYKDLVNVESIFFMQSVRKGYRNGIASYLPVDLHMAGKRWLTQNKLNVYIGMASPMDEHGFFSMGLSMAIEKDFIEAADIVILEVNPNVPKVYGDTAIHISDVSMVVETNHTLATFPRSAISDTDMTIGEYASSLINDGDTIQLGIGGMGEAIAKKLQNKHDLGIHTEMINNGMLDLIKTGVVTGRKKSLNKGKVIGSFALGEQALYDLIEDNPSIEIRAGRYVNNPFIIAQNDNMVSVNSALAVDLVGQCSSETIGTKQYSGSGGQMDTAYGATHAKNGRSIIVTPSTRKNGEVSCITAMLPQGSVVSLGRNIVDYVVTEYGIAYIRGCSVKKRTENLIAIAHPNFRSELRKQAEKLEFI